MQELLWMRYWVDSFQRIRAGMKKNILKARKWLFELLRRWRTATNISYRAGWVAFLHHLFLEWLRLMPVQLRSPFGACLGAIVISGIVTPKGHLEE